MIGILLCFAGGLTSAAIANALVGALGRYLPVFGQSWGRIGALGLLYSGVAVANVLEAGMPVVFDVLCHEIRGLAMNIQLEKTSGDDRPILD